MAEERDLTCIVPRELADELLGPVRRAFRDEPDVRVMVERRVRERRSDVERRQDEGNPFPGEERRAIRAEGGRRIGERRAQLVPALVPESVRHLDGISLVERIEASQLTREDGDTAVLVMRIQDGEKDLVGRLYERYFDRVYTYLYVTLQDCYEVEDITQDVFMRVIDALPRYERRAAPFRSWLFRIARNCAINRLGQRQRSRVESPEQIARRVEAAGEVDEPASLEWLEDRELLGLIKRLPDEQRQVIVLRYLLEFRSDEIAEVLGRRADAVRQLHHRAMKFLRDQLEARHGGPRAAGLEPAGGSMTAAP